MRLRLSVLLILAFGTLCTFYYSLTDHGSCGSSSSTTTSLATARQETTGEAVSHLISAGLRSKLTNHSLERKCPMYSEFRNVDFLSPALREELCSNAEAYKLYPDGYPVCQLPNPFPSAMLEVVQRNAEVGALKCADNATLQIYMYKGNDYISARIRRSHIWEQLLVQRTLKFAMKLHNVTFLDVGSNIGVYSIQAARLGLPVVAVDANIRNLLRLRLSLDAASLEAALVWNFIADDQQLKYLGFLADCNVGGAGRDKAQLPDTVPVMPLRSERLASLIKTAHIVLKMDIQGGESEFLTTAGRLFEDFKVALVQMEWQPDLIHGKDAASMLEFFVSRGYRVRRAGSLKPLDPTKSKSWRTMDIVWVHRNYSTSP